MNKAPKKQYTGVPDILFDSWLPELDDTELRTILVIIRKTIGWRQSEDELSLNGIAKLAGISKSSVARATNSLIERGLIGRRKNLAADATGQTESTYWLRFDDESDDESGDTPVSPMTQGLSHPRTTPVPPVGQPPVSPVGQVIGRDLNTYLQTETTSVGFNTSPEYKTPASQLPKMFFSKYNQKRGAKLDAQAQHKAKAKIWLGNREESPDEILGAQECFFADPYWAEAGYPFPSFVAQFEKYLEEWREIVRGKAQGEPQHEEDFVKVLPTPTAATGAPQPAQRDFLTEWNSAVPDAFTEHEPRRKVNIEPEFIAAFDKICEVARGIRKNKPDSTWLDFYWLLATKPEFSRPNWTRLITTMRGMALSKNPESGQNDDEERYQNWKIGKGLPRGPSERMAWSLRSCGDQAEEEETA